MEEYTSLESPVTPSSPVSTSSRFCQEGHQSVSSKVCCVCGDKALGCNFNAITCESCKAFFRRNALKGKEFKCPFDGNCKIDQITRRFCQKCRLQKCFTIGMKKELIMSEQERSVKRRKIEENRLKKISEFAECRKVKKSRQLADLLLSKSIDGKSEADSSFSDSDISASPLDNSLENSVDGRVHSIQSSSKIAIQTEGIEIVAPSVSALPNSLESSTLCNTDSSNDKLKWVSCPFKGELDTVESMMNIAIRAEYNVDVNLVRGDDSSVVSPVRDKQLNEMEQAKLQELVIANKALLAPLIEDGPIKQNTADPTLLNVLNLTDIAIRRIIKMSKKLVAFKTLCQEDQIALVKGGCTELMILRSVMSYDRDKGCWKIPHTDSHMNHIKVEVLKEARGNVYEEHQRFIQSFDPLWRSDEQIMLLLSAITLFDAERPNVVHRDAIKLEQESYYYLLRRYLESVVGGCEARSMYLQLIQKVSELHILNDNHVRVYLDLNPKEVEPLLIEIFDLKSR